MPKKTSTIQETDLRTLLIMKLQALYDTETRLIKALPKLAKKANNKELKDAFETHLELTKEHAERLAGIFEQMGQKPKKLKSAAIAGLIKDAEWVTKNVKGEGLDAALIAATQYVEHYEMAGYGTAAQWAEDLGEIKIKETLGETLEEEKTADEILSRIAKSRVNEEVPAVGEREQ